MRSSQVLISKTIILLWESMMIGGLIELSYSNRAERRAWFVKEPVMGSHFGGCTCGKANTEGVPCHHMVG
jgi:hypothetical protein